MEFGVERESKDVVLNDPDTTAEGAGRTQDEVHVDPTRMDGLPWFRRSYDDNDNICNGNPREPSLWNAPMGIVIPTIYGSFNIKKGLIAAIQKHKFHGQPGEDSLGHLDTFNQLCVVYNVGSVSLDDVRMALFPFSLADRASHWKRGIPSEFVSNWDDVKKEFLNTFFTREETTKFRGYITSFKQINHESFIQAWRRIKRYFRMCPHHDFSKKLLLEIFYRGCDENNRMHMDAACKGRFMDVNIKEGERLIATLANGGDQDYDRNFKLGET